MWSIKQLFKYICLMCIILFIGSSSALADVLTYNDTLKQAVENSFDIKISKLDIDISRAELKTARADLFPTLYTQLNTEYNNGLGNTKNINYVGNTVISSYTQFRNLASIGLSYNFFDFGATNKKILMAKKNVEQKQVMADLQLKDLKLKILDLYTKTLQCNNEIKTKAKILKVYEEMFNNKERLYKAGTTDKISLMNEAVKIARTQDDIVNSKLLLRNTLTDLSAYTLQNYTPENIEIKSIEEKDNNENIVEVNDTKSLKLTISEDKITSEFDPYESLESRYYDLEIDKKKAELAMYKKQRLPAFRFYTNYLLYGQDPSQYFSSFSEFKQASVAFGVSSTYTFFDGFKNKASREKASLEIKKLEFEKEKKLIDVKNQYEKSYESYQTYIQELTLKKELLSTVEEKLSAIERMSKSGLAPKTEILTAKAELLNQEFELQKNISDISYKLKEIQIMTGEDI